MPNDPTGATGEAMPRATAFPLTATDPMLDLVLQFRSVGEAYTRVCLSADSEQDQQVFYQAHVEPLRQRIWKDRPRVTSIDGARECVRTMLMENNLPDGMERSLLRGVLDYLDTLPPVVRACTMETVR